MPPFQTSAPSPSSPLRALAGLSLAAVVAFTPILGASSSGKPGREQAREAGMRGLRAESTLPIAARIDERTGAVATLRGRFRTTGNDPVERSRRFLERHSVLLGMAPGLGDLHPVRTSQDRGGAVVTWQQEHRGVNVFGGVVKAGLAPDGALIHLASGYVPDLDLPVSGRIKRDEAITIAQRFLGAGFDRLHGQPALSIVSGGKGNQGHHLAWKVEGSIVSPPGQWQLFVSATTGSVVRSSNLLKFVGAPCTSCNPATDTDCGSFFFSDPVVFFDDPNLRDSDNVDGAQVGCILGNLSSSTNLDGLYVSTSITFPRVGPPYNYLRSTSETAIDEITTYFTIDRAKRYLNTLGFPGVMNFALPADAHDGSVGLNAFYSPIDIEVHFGQGGVDAGQDPAVIYHEYGHAIQDNQVPGWGSSHEGGSMGEGFGDFWAAALLDGSSATDLGNACAASWWATFINPYTGAFGTGCLRRLDFPWVYPRDSVFGVHADGEIWSAALWDLRAALGATTTDELVIKAHTYMTPSAKFIDGVDALLSADNGINSGNNVSTIKSIMQARGLPRSAAPASTAALTETTSFSCSSNHPYNPGEYKECLVTVPGARRLRLHFSSLNVESNFDYIYVSDPNLNQVQELSGNLGAMNSATVEGDTILARFKADGGVQASGFDIDSVEFTLGAGHVPDGSLPGDSGVQATSAPNFDVTLTWDASCASGDVDYAIYKGSLFTLQLLSSPVTCSTGGATSFTFSGFTGSEFYLVVPNNGAAEGSYGLDSFGGERATNPVSACFPQEIRTTCP